MEATTSKMSFRTPERVRTSDEVLPIYKVVSRPRRTYRSIELTKKTTETLRRKATIALASRMKTPTR